MQLSIKACRANANMSMKDFAKELKVAKQTIANWEKGITEPNASALKKISELSGVPMENIKIGE